VSVPVGIGLGRGIIEQLTRTLGIVPGMDVSPAPILGIAVVSIVAANLLALIPARHPARPLNALLNRERYQSLVARVSTADPGYIHLHG
jgi:hypothetical protein